MVDQTVSGLWSSTESRLHINALESAQDEGSDPNFTPPNRGKCVLIRSDNTTVVSHIKRQRGTHSLSLFQLTQQLFQWSIKNQVTLRVKLIPGHLNTMADLLSRKEQIIKAEWTYSQHVSITNVCESIPRWQSLGNRCPHNQLNKSNRLCFSTPTTIIVQVVRIVEETDCIIVLVAQYRLSQT